MESTLPTREQIEDCLAKCQAVADQKQALIERAYAADAPAWMKDELIKRVKRERYPEVDMVRRCKELLSR